MSHEVAITIRPFTRDDVAARSEAWRWVVNSWLKSYFEHCRGLWDGAHSKEYWTQHWNVATALIERGTVLLAHQPDAPDLFVGWACGEPANGVCHYVYVKQPFRRDGVAIRLVHELLGASPKDIRYTHQPARRELRDAAQKLGWVYSPYALIGGHSDDHNAKAG